MRYNDQQQEIIDNIEGAFLVSAPVGTGKTSVLTARILSALGRGVRPEEILALTFTNRAAEEMSGRIREQLRDKGLYERLLIKTFHGFCAYLVRAEAKALGIDTDFSICDDAEQKEILARVLEAYPEIGVNDKRNFLPDMTEKLYQRRLAAVRIRIGHPDVKLGPDPLLDRINDDYIRALSDQNCLDFNELVIRTIEALYLDEAARRRWIGRFRLIQLDEFQDTHLSEYLVVKELAKTHGNIALIGDLDQTIYSWRGSEPHHIVAYFRRHFPKARTFHLEINYRFNPHLLEAVKSFLGAMENPVTKKISSHTQGGGELKCVKVFGAMNFTQEISRVAEMVKTIRDREPQARIAVLARSNPLIADAAEVFSRQGVAHVTVDKFDFFRRQEVRDIFACLKIIFNRFDLDSAYRLAARPPRQIGPKTIQEIRRLGEDCRLKISDFLHFPNFKQPEPFAGLIRNWQSGRIVVLDTETTGTDPGRDEIIQIYAVELVNGRPGRDFSRYLRNTRPVGASEAVHQLSDEFLRQNGRDPLEVLGELKDFIGNSPVAGHNVNFDLAMIAENGRRLGADPFLPEYYDTLDLSRRLFVSENYKLSTLAGLFGLSAATHDARDDVLATAGLLGICVEKLRPGAIRRQEVFGRFAPKFIKLAAQIQDWEKTVKTLRPDQALAGIWEDSGLRDHYAKDKDSARRFKSIESLVCLFVDRDRAEDPPDRSMRELIRYASLVRDINFLGLEQGKVPIVTVHQVKGLEFDHVFIVGLNEYRFPVHQGDPEEEKRLFYVALTRARQTVHLSYSSQDRYGRPQAQSPFISFLDEKYIENV